MEEVTDPEILSQFNTEPAESALPVEPSKPVGKEVTDPAILSQFSPSTEELSEPNRLRAKYGFDLIEDAPEAIPTAPEERSLIGSFGAGVRRGAVGVGTQIGRGVSYIGAEAGLPGLEEVGDITSEYYEDIIKERPEWQPAKEQADREWYHPERLAETVGEAIPMTAGAMGAGILAGLAAPVGVAGSAVVAAGTAGTAFGLTTAGETLKEAEKAGISRDEALKAARLHGIGEAALEFIPDFMFMRMLKLAGKAGKPMKKEVLEEGIKRLPKLKAFAKDMGKIGLMESAEEGMQTAWGNYVAQGYYDPERAIAAGVPESMAVGAIMGIGLGGVGHIAGAVGREDVAPPSPAPIEGQDTVDAAIKEDVRKPTLDEIVEEQYRKQQAARPEEVAPEKESDIETLLREIKEAKAEEAAPADRARTQALVEEAYTKQQAIPTEAIESQDTVDDQIREDITRDLTEEEGLEEIGPVEVFRVDNATGPKRDHFTFVGPEARATAEREAAKLATAEGQPQAVYAVPPEEVFDKGGKKIGTWPGGADVYENEEKLDTGKFEAVTGPIQPMSDERVRSINRLRIIRDTPAEAEAAAQRLGVDRATVVAAAEAIDRNGMPTNDIERSLVNLTWADELTGQVQAQAEALAPVEEVPAQAALPFAPGPEPVTGIPVSEPAEIERPPSVFDDMFVEAKKPKAPKKPEAAIAAIPTKEPRKVKAEIVEEVFAGEKDGYKLYVDEAAGKRIIEHPSGSRLVETTKDGKKTVEVIGSADDFGKRTTVQELDDAREDVDTSPTDAQIKQGNYKKGHLTIQGLDITIENPKGSERTGMEDGDPWTSKMHVDYGYIKKSEGADGEHIDVYVGPNLEADTAHAIHQIEPETGKYDEDKVMIGFDSQKEAEAAYRKQYDQGMKVKPDRIGAVTSILITALKFKIKNNEIIGEEAIRQIEYKPAAQPRVEVVTEPSPKEAAPTPSPEIAKEEVPAPPSLPLVEEGDITTKAGNPFKSERAARTGIVANKKQGQGYVPVEVEGGWVARPTVKKPKITVTRADIIPTRAGVVAVPIEEEVKEPKVDIFAANKLFTSDKVAAARERMRGKLETLHVGFDPEMLQDGVTIAGAYIEAGTRSFAAYSKAMVDDFGEAIKPYLRSFYEGVRHFPGLDTEGMTSPEEIDAIKEEVAKPEKPAKLKEKGVEEDERTRDVGKGEGALEEVLPGEGRPDGEKQRPDTGKRGVSKVDVERDERPPRDRGERGIGVGGIEGVVHPDRAGVQSLEEPITEPRSLKKRGTNPGNYQITAADKIGAGTRGDKIDNNLAAIRLVKELDKENRYPTKEEQAVLIRYVGWGGLKNVFDKSSKKPQDQKALAELESLLTESELFEARQSVQSAHYTSKTVIGSMYDVVDHLGIKGGHILEPTYGTGLFTGLMPEKMSESSKWYGSEMDMVTAKIGQYLYPRAQFLNSPFEEAQFPYNKFDMAIGNPPFGDWRITDTNKRRSEINGMKVHNYVIGKSGMHVKPGGIMSFVVTSRFMDTADPEIRNYLAKKFNFLGAVRLPNTAFKEMAGTDVTTDIVIFQKLMPGEKPSTDTTWLDTKGTMENERGEEVKLNRYFAENSSQMLGIPSMQGKMYGAIEKKQFTLEPKEGLDVREAVNGILDDQLSYLKDIASQNEQDVADALAMSVELNKEGVGIGGYFVENKAIFMRMDDDVDGNPVYEKITPDTQWTAKTTLGLKRYNRIKGLLGLRAKAYELISAERFDLPTMTELRKELNDLYDKFVDKNGYINDSANRSLMSEDIKIEAGLEHGYRKPISKARAVALGVPPSKSKAEKASILKERIYFPQKEILHADSAYDGYGISMSEKGKLDIPYIAELTNKTDDKVAQELSDLGLAFKDPETEEWIQEDEYLSGNVKEKFRKVENNADFKKNADALEKVLPADLVADDIFVDMGATWVPKGVYEAFAAALGIANANISVTPQTGRVMITSSGTTTENDLSVMLKNPDYGIVALFNSVANNKALVAHDGSGDTRTINRERTNALKSIAKKTKGIFKDWIFADSAQAEKLAEIYNETQNTHAPRVIDGKHLKTVGANPAVQLYNTQRTGAWRMIQQPSVLLDHVVGAGKTMTMITGVQERKRLGISKKPVIVVPNHIIPQWGTDYAGLYPGANILVASEKDFASKNRKRLLARMATGSYDAIIIGHSSLSFIPLEAETQSKIVQEEMKFLEDALAEAEAAGESKRAVSTLANRIEKKRQRIKKLMDMPKSEVATWESMGIDYLVLDESHEFKNLEYSTYMQSMAGMGNPQGSMKAFDLYAKLRYLSDKDGGVTFATGTPISNSLVEMYSLLRYLNYEELQKRGLGAFDSWAKAYAGIENRIEYTSTQKLKERTVMASFNNLPELKQLYTEFADVVNQDDLKSNYKEQSETWNRLNPDKKPRSTVFPIPKVEGGERQIDIADSSPAQKEYMDYLVARAEAIEEKTDPEYRKIDNVLWVMNDARKAALDIRLVDPTADPGTDTKIDRTAKSVKEYYDRWEKDKGTQMVFCDLSTPLKQADKAAESFIKKALKKGGLDKDSRIKYRLEGMEPGEKWAYIKHEINAKIDRLSTRDNEADIKERERLEEFIHGITDEDTADLTTSETKFSVYDELKATLVRMGIPENEVKFIHEANTPAKKEEMFELVNSGRVRVLIGSSKKMGAGTNAQERLVALHHMDAPWRPSDVEQREGRIIRQGNSLYLMDPKGFVVAIKTYSTRNTNDTVMWQILARKAEMIESLKSDKRSVKEDTSDSASYANLMAEASGNPAFKEKFKLEGEIAELESTERRITANRSAAARTVENVDRDIANATDRIHDREQGVKKLAAAKTFKYDGKEYEDDLAEGYKKAEKEWRSDEDKYNEDIKPWFEWVDGKPLKGDFENNADWSKAYDEYLEEHPEPKKPKQPVGMEALSRVRKHSKTAELIHEVADNLADAPIDTLISLDFGAIELSIEKASDPWKGKDSVQYISTFDGYDYSSTYSTKDGRPTHLVTNLLNKESLTVYADSRAESAVEDLASVKKHAEAAKLTLDKVQFKEVDELAEKKARYEQVKTEVADLEVQMEQERKGKRNKYIAMDKTRDLAKPEETPALSRSKDFLGEEITELLPGMKEEPRVNDIRVIVDLITTKWKNAPEVRVVHSIDKLPQDLQDHVKSLTGEGAIRGLFYKGKVYLVANNISSGTAAAEVLFHEALGHYGLRGMLGQDIRPVLNQVYIKYRKEAQRVAKLYGIDLSKEAGRMDAAEEVLAGIAQNNSDIGILAKVVAAIRSWLRKAGFDISLSDKDIKALVARAARFVKKGGERKAPILERVAPMFAREYTAEQKEALGKIAPETEPETVKERLDKVKENLGLKIKQSVVDQYASLKEFTKHGYMLARMVSTASGKLEAAFRHGKLRMLKDGAITVDTSGKGLANVLTPLGGELNDFFAWIAGNRAEGLAKEDRERLFDKTDIKALKALNQGNMEDGRVRSIVYAQVHKEFKEFQESVLDIAEQSGLINAKERETWEQDFYIPFYRVLEDQADTQGPKTLESLTGQTAIKRLKGADIKLNDLLSNVLMNWNHLISASLKNNAAKVSLDAAVKMKAATPIKRGKTQPTSPNAVFVRENGRKVWYEVNEPLVLESLTSLNWDGFNSRALKAMRKFKRAFTIGVTASPEFRIANLLRDTIQSVAVGKMNYNMVDNALGTGWKGTKRGSITEAKMMAGGGMMHFGHEYGADPDAARLMVEKGIKDDTILNNPKAFKNAKQALNTFWDTWKEFGSRLENVNRAALYEKRVKEVGELKANFEARDLMDFTNHGAAPAVRFLIQVVPFLNARMQGLYKLGKAAMDKDQQAQLAAVTSMVALASMALFLTFKDDDEFKEREEWDRDTYWWFKVPGSDKAFRIPKPFEVGAIGTLAERMLEQIVDDEAHGELFAERLGHMIVQTFAFSVVPQMLQPTLDIYSNINPFTDRPIESMGMERLSKTERKKAWTSETTIALSKGMDAVLWDKVVLSPVQIEYMVKGYLGWIGAMTLGTIDNIFMEPLTGAPTEPTRRIDDYPAVGRFVRSNPVRNTKYATLFYEQLQEMNTAYSDVQNYRKLREFNKAKESRQKNIEKLRWRSYFNKQQKRLSKITARMKLIQLNKVMSAEEKRNQIDLLQREKNRILKIAVERRDI